MAWLKEHAAESAARLRPGASEATLAALAGAVGGPLPPELVALWRFCDGLPIFEYAGLGVDESRLRREGLEDLRTRGIFANHQVFEQSSPRIQPTKWHPGWLPLAEDGCGNMYCVDLAPGPAGRVGQVIRWENAGGPFAASSVDLAAVLERYASALESGRYTYDVDSGIFDGPFLDLLAP